MDRRSHPLLTRQRSLIDIRFLWVSLAVPIMFQKLTRFDMKLALEDMPSGPDGLSQMVERTMFNVLKLQSSAEVRLARHALLWLALGLGQLSPKAICEAAAVDSDSLNLDEDKVPAPRTVERVCLGLVHLDKNTGAIRLLHNSLRDYIVAKQQELFSDGQPFFDGQAEIARTCIHYLFMQDLSDMSDQLEDDSLPFQEGDKLSLLKYSACYWDCHVRKSLPNDTINRMALELLLDWHRMGRILEIRGHISDYPSPTSAMHLAARFGLPAAVEALIEEGPMDMYQLDDKGNTLLHEAAKEGWVSVIKLLLDQGARVEVSDNNSRSPLFWAVQKGHTGAVILLLRVSNLEGQDNVLGAAAAKGNMEVIHALLESYPWSEAAVQHALVESVRHNHQQVASLLLDQGLAPTGDALCAAVIYGNEEMIGMLLYQGADPNALNFEGRGVASCAARIGNTRIMDMLIDAGANVDTQDADGITPLFEAIRCSHSKLVKFLLRAGANVQVTQQGTGRTLLHEAARTGDRFVIQELLDAGADLAVYDSDGKLPYQLAGTSDIEILLKGNNSPELKVPESQDTVKRELSDRFPETLLRENNSCDSRSLDPRDAWRCDPFRDNGFPDEGAVRSERFPGRELSNPHPRDAERWDRFREERSERLPEIVSGRELRYSDPRDAERWDRLQEEDRRFRDEEMELT
jgi:ankyrin repeat protein